MNNSGSWIIHGSRLLHRGGVVHEAVFGYCKWTTTKMM